MGAVGIFMNARSPIALNPNTTLLVLLLVFLLLKYFSQFLYHTYAYERKGYFMCFGSAFAQGFKNITAWMGPYAIIICIFAVIGFFSNMVIFRFVPIQVARMLQLLLIMLFITWYRFFIVVLLRRKQA